MALKLLNKAELNELGSKGFFYKQLAADVTYISGFPELDSKINTNTFFEAPALVTFRKRTQGLEIRVLNNFKLYTTGIKAEDIKAINLEDQNQITQQKEKSVIGRALVGGLILGPVGAIVGGMTGIGTKEKALYTPDLFLAITYKGESGEDAVFVCSCKYKDRAAVSSFFNKEYKNLFIFG